MTVKRPSQDSRPEGLGVPSFRTPRPDTTVKPLTCQARRGPRRAGGQNRPPMYLLPSPPQPWAGRRVACYGGIPSDACKENVVPRFSVLFSANATKNGEKIEAHSQYRCSYSAKPREKTLP